MKPSFTAIDFETATRHRVSICQIGLVRVEEGKIVKKISQLVQPPDNYFEFMNTRIHGITPRETEDSPTFDQIWKSIRKYFHNQTVVAHQEHKITLTHHDALSDALACSTLYQKHLKKQGKVL
jgi:DNA polymerase-3 subunit epsilon